MTPRFVHSFLPVASWPGIKSLAWQGDALIDWLQSTRIYHLDGSVDDGVRRYAYSFDAVATSPSGNYTILYERLGTRAIVLRDFEVIREISRSYYQADAFDYPIGLFRLADGREAIAHAPDIYNRIEIDLLETGERLTARPPNAPDPIDYFPSGLVADPAGEWLMSTGWVWHPAYAAAFYPLPAALGDPSILDANHFNWDQTETTAGAWLGRDRVALASDPEADCYVEEDQTQPDTIPYPGRIGIYRPSSREWESDAMVGEPIGQLLQVDELHVLALHDHPKLIHVPSGEIVERWHDIPSGPWAGCITHHLGELPPTAWDPEGRRLAVASAEGIHLLTLDRLAAVPVPLR